MKDMYDNELKIGDIVVWCDVKFNSPAKNYIRGEIVAINEYVEVRLIDANFFIRNNSKNGIVRKKPNCIIKIS